MKTKELTLGKRIRFAREKAGLTQQELGDLLFVSKSSVSTYENDNANPSPASLATIAKSANVTLDWLITGSNSGHSDKNIENAVNEHSAGWECKGEEFSETEQRIIGMLRRLTPEMRQIHFDGITTSYFNQMEKEIESIKKIDRL